jgi:hypothetical protein
MCCMYASRLAATKSESTESKIHPALPWRPTCGGAFPITVSCLPHTRANVHSSDHVSYTHPERGCIRESVSRSLRSRTRVLRHVHHKAQIIAFVSLPCLAYSNRYFEAVGFSLCQSRRTSGFAVMVLNVAHSGAISGLALRW